MTPLLSTAYLLVHEVFVLALDAQSQLHLLQLGSLFKDGSVHVQQFPLHHLALKRQQDELTTIFELASKTFERLGDLAITTSRLSRQSGFSSSETNERISVICLLVCLKLETRLQRLVAHCQSTSLPVFIDGLCMLQNGRGIEVVERGNHHVIGDNGIVNRCKWRLLSRGVLEHLHDAFKVILRERTSRRALRVVRLQELGIIAAHIIQAADAFLHGLRKPNVRGWLVEITRVYIVVVDFALLRRRNRNLLGLADSGVSENALKMVFLKRGGKEEAVSSKCF